MRIWIAALALACAPLAAGAHPGHEHTPPWQDASPWPDRVIVTFSDDPARTLSVSWRTDDTVTETVAEIAPATADARFDRASTTVGARTERIDLAAVTVAGASHDVSHNARLGKAHYHSVVFRDLKPDTLYAYRVRGALGTWSEWFQTRTAPDSGPVTFVYLGDAQDAVLSHWSRVVRAAFQKAPNARFFLHAGDLVNRGSRDFEWAEWFKAVGFIHGMIPAIPVSGNHEYERYAGTQVLSHLWRPQFTLPVDESLPEELRETVYVVKYTADLHIFVLDSTNRKTLPVQAAWLDAQLAASTARWKIVSQHHPVFSSGNERDSPDLRATLLPILRKHRVDLMLQGHDHTYARGAAPQTPERLSDGASGIIDTMFVNSVSGPKMYNFRGQGWDDYRKDGVGLVRKAENTPFFQTITVDGDRLSYDAWTADGQLYDTFALRSRPDGRNDLIRGTAATIDERAFRNTAPYGGVGDLR